MHTEWDFRSDTVMNYGDMPKNKVLARCLFMCYCPAKGNEGSQYTTMRFEVISFLMYNKS